MIVWERGRVAVLRFCAPPEGPTLAEKLLGWRSCVRWIRWARRRAPRT